MQNIRYHSIGKNKESLLDFLTRRFLYHSRQEWSSKIAEGKVYKDGKIEKNAQILLKHDHLIGYKRDFGEEPEIDPSHRILFEDEFIIVVEKSGNIPISESGRYYRNTLINVLKKAHDLSELFAVHRLDRETSGVLVIAKNKEVATQLGEQFSDSKTKKFYEAILKGELEKDEVTVNQPIKKSPKDALVRIRMLIKEEGKESKTHFKVLIRKSTFTKVQVQTFTGRTHQIRVHSEWLGHPILGDKLYGQDDETFLNIMKGRQEPVFGEFGLINRQLLHASILEFNHPVSGKTIQFESDSRPFFEKFIPSV